MHLSDRTGSEGKGGEEGVACLQPQLMWAIRRAFQQLHLPVQVSFKLLKELGLWRHGHPVRYLCRPAAMDARVRGSTGIPRGKGRGGLDGTCRPRVQLSGLLIHSWLGGEGGRYCHSIHNHIAKISRCANIVIPLRHIIT